MLCKRVIAAVLICNGNVVQTRQFKATNIVGKVETAVKFSAAWDADDIMLIDIGKTPWPGMLKTVEAVTQNVFVPVMVGGHINRMQQVRDVFNAGGDKVLVRTAAWMVPEFVRDVAIKCGSQAIAVCIDHDGRNVHPAPHLIAAHYAGDIVVNSTRNDGMKSGFDLEVLRIMAKTSHPIIAMGGCGKPEHAVEAFRAGADAVAIGNLLHYKEHAIVEIKRAAKAAGFPIRDSHFVVG